MKYLKLKTESDIPFRLVFPAAQKANVFFYFFSHLTCWLSKVRNRLDAVKRGELHLSLTTLQPDIHDLASAHRAQGAS